MENKIKEWKEDDNEHYEEYPFVYDDYKNAYDAAKSANIDGNKDYDTLYANLETQFDNLKRLVNSGYVSDDLESGNTPIGITNMIFQLYKGMMSSVTTYLDTLSGSSTSTTAAFGFDFNSIADKIFPTFKTIAYAIIIIFAGVNALESALQYEMFTMRGGVKILGRLILAKLWIDLSLVICRSIVTIITEWLKQILSITTSISDNINMSIHIESSDAWIIGWLIDFFNGFLMALAFLLLILPLIVLVVILIIKLFVRAFEIAMLQCVAPVFFACLTGETTKIYFKKFILTYISTVAEVIFMAIVWYTYISYMDSAFGGESLNAGDAADIFKFDSGILSFFLVSVGAYILMIKPPKVLKNLITS